ncbi:MAG: thermonuclease family protein [Pseudomonadota bacterium]
MKNILKDLRAGVLATLGLAALLGPFSADAGTRNQSAPTSFSCPAPEHHDGDAIRCGSKARSMRLYGIDAPEMPGACRPGRVCTPGDPIAARDHLRSLTAGKTVSCRQVDRDRYGRAIVRCISDGRDLSCVMVRDGFAVERYGRLDCAQR